MKKTPLVIAILLFCYITAPAQTWRWAQRGGGSFNEVQSGREDETVVDMATDKNGNLYVLSNLFPESNNLDIAGASLNPMGGFGLLDIVISSFKCDGTLRWTKVIGATADDRGVALNTDTLGGVYIAGNAHNWMNNVQFGANDTILAPGTQTLFLVKYDTSGVFKWIRRPEADTMSYNSMLKSRRIWDMDVDAAGNVFMLAELRPGAYANGSYIIPDTSVHMLKYDRNGSFQGGTRMAITYNPSDNPLSALTFRRNPLNGNIYVTGRQNYMAGTLHFGATLVDKAMFLGAFTSSGSFLWVRQNNVGGIPGLGRYLHRPLLDAAGNIYVAGNSYHGDSFAGYAINNSFSTLSYKLSVMLKLDAAGNLVWGRNSSGIGVFGEGPWTTHGSSAISGNVVALADGYGGTLRWSGYADSVVKPLGGETDVFLACFNTTTGAVIKIDTLSSNFTGTEYPTGMIADRNGSFYVGGSMNEEIHLNGTITSAGGHADFFVAKYGFACNCTAPASTFNKSVVSRNITLTYTGAITGIDSVIWSFGNGITQKKTGAAISTAFTYTYPANGNYAVCATAYNACGNNQSCQNVSIAGVGVSQPSGLNDIRIYPNPAKDFATVVGCQPGTTIAVMNMVGQEVIKPFILTAGQPIGIAGLAAGTYLLRLIGTDGASGSLLFSKQ